MGLTQEADNLKLKMSRFAFVFVFAVVVVFVFADQVNSHRIRNCPDLGGRAGVRPRSR